MRNTARKSISPAWAFLAFVVVFIVYGSLFPFDFRDQPDKFDSLISRYALFSNTADAIDNFLLFIPLGIALQTCFQSALGRLNAAGVAILSLGFGLQILQLYLPSRTASLADTFWNSIGLFVGLLFAGFVRKRFGIWFAGASTANIYALVLVLLWFFYEAFPFVPTLDLVMLRDHVKTAVFPPPFETTRFIQHLLAAILCGIALQRARPLGHGGGLSAVIAGTAAVLLEILVAYGSLRRETLLGMTVGLTSGYLLARGGDRLAIITLAAAASCAYLIAIFTPYRGQIADGGFTITPFSSFLWRNVTGDLPPLAFEALAIGSLFWAGLFRQGFFRNHPALWGSMVFLMIALLEAVRVFATGFHGDTTTLAIAAVLYPFAIAYPHQQDTTTDRHPEAHLPQKALIHEDRPKRPAGRARTISIVLLAGAIYLSARLPGIPYNIHEVFPSGFDGILTALSLATIMWLMANSPFLLISAKSLRRLIFFPLSLAMQGVLVWILLRLFIPLESMHDIVGAPTLGWPWEWERLLRFLVLHQAIAMQLVGAVLVAATLCRPAQLVGLSYWAIIALLLAWPMHFVMVDWAATDNLTELMREGGNFLASSLLAAGILLACLSGATLGAAIAVPSYRRRMIVAALLAVPLATGCFIAGLEPVLVKYGKVFSAAQFLLSPDREHYLPNSTLLIRFAVAYALFAITLAILQYRSWKNLSQQIIVRQGIE